MPRLSPPPYLLDVHRLLWRGLKAQASTGVDRVCEAYVAHFGRHAQAVVRFNQHFWISSPHGAQVLFAYMLAPQTWLKTKLALLQLKEIFLFWCYQRGNNRLYFNIGQTGIEGARFARWMRWCRVRPIFFLHDIIPITHAEYARADETARHEKRIAAMAQYGHGIICNSQDVKNALEHYAARKQLALPPVLAAPLGVHIKPAVTALRAPISAPYFIMLGTIEARKNHLLLLKIWRELAVELGAHCPKLIIIGKRGWECEQAIDMLERCEEIKPHVREYNNLPDEDVVQWLHGARALLFPSFCEGFGLPLVEALHQRTPVIASDLAVFKEIAGDIPEYISPIDGLGWKAAVLDYATPESQARARQLERMHGYSAPTWAEHFTLVENWLKTLV
jgi:glycosyltransferase involved in cell wall biosynthesis